MQLALEVYTPGEAELITKVTQATVRNWRRAGHLPRHAGHARYSAADLLVQFAMQALVARGVSPDAAKGFAGEIARAIFQSMIYSHKSYSAGVNNAAREEVGEIAPDRVEALMAAVDGLTLETIELLDRQKHMMDAATQAFGISGLKSPNWLIIWANGELEFYYDGDNFEDRFFGETVYNEFVQGPVILFSLSALAQVVIDRLPRPAIRLKGEV